MAYRFQRMLELTWLRSTLLEKVMIVWGVIGTALMFVIAVAVWVTGSQWVMNVAAVLIALYAPAGFYWIYKDGLARLKRADRRQRTATEVKSE
ncbi:hypothetical protein [Orlajensenia leifsoniae]|uniref:Uncharacterized protein n=1 Tax=Orlajensenia leifsoniae TaxID=2561933 RepID=A0A4Y9QS06_9MICO|nr:hypothetical protein [Leifsonia flava]TFV95284.1 hypothetical protein E4M00_14615 [Leifsonia flava]